MMDRGVCLRGLSRERGASAVEFAIVASLLFMVVFGTVQFGIAYNRYQGLTAAGREGARLASINATGTQVVDRVKESTSIIDTTSTNFNPSCDTVSLSDQQSCVGIQYLSTGGTYTNMTNTDFTTFTPCDKADSVNSANPTVKVYIKYRMRIQIPFVGNMTPTLTGDGIFRCER